MPVQGKADPWKVTGQQHVQLFPRCFHFCWQGFRSGVCGGSCLKCDWNILIFCLEGAGHAVLWLACGQPWGSSCLHRYAGGRSAAQSRMESTIWVHFYFGVVRDGVAALLPVCRLLDGAAGGKAAAPRSPAEPCATVTVLQGADVGPGAQAAEASGSRGRNLSLASACGIGHLQWTQVYMVASLFRLGHQGQWDVMQPHGSHVVSTTPA